MLCLSTRALSSLARALQNCCRGALRATQTKSLVHGAKFAPELLDMRRILELPQQSRAERFGAHLLLEEFGHPGASNQKIRLREVWHLDEPECAQQKCRQRAHPVRHDHGTTREQR